MNTALLRELQTSETVTKTEWSAFDVVSVIITSKDLVSKTTDVAFDVKLSFTNGHANETWIPLFMSSIAAKKKLQKQTSPFFDVVSIVVEFDNSVFQATEVTWNVEFCIFNNESRYRYRTVDGWGIWTNNLANKMVFRFWCCFSFLSKQ